MASITGAVTEIQMILLRRSEMADLGVKVLQCKADDFTIVAITGIAKQAHTSRSPMSYHVDVSSMILYRCAS